ncbi:MAG: ribosomal protein [Alphaproteobacteria bacterium]|jgi:large subunit ribosomal protein L9|nr:ribosomal protein [Alphaproteobacteria bacterium]
MQVILLERVEKLGQMGQVVTVKAGYARNFLLPKKKALRATKQNLGFFEDKRLELEASNLKRKSEAEVVAKKMDNAMISLIRQASEMGHLYGSVRSADIVQGLGEVGFSVSRGQVQIDVPIKYLGMHQVRILLHPEVSITVNVNVAQSEEEAAVQAAAQSKAEGAPVHEAEAAFGGKEEAGSDKKKSETSKEANLKMNPKTKEKASAE